MARLNSRYPLRTRIRALELYHRAGGDCATSEIISLLKGEGHGDVSKNAIQRWLREDPSRCAVRAVALGQHVRHQAEYAKGNERATERIRLASNQLADTMEIAAKRAREILEIDIRTTEDFARFGAFLRDIGLACVEGYRARLELLTLEAAYEEAADDSQN